MGPTAHETTSALSSSLVETSSTQFKSFDSTVSTTSGTSILVAKPRNFFKGVLLEQESAQVTLVTDASQSGWGAHINNYQIAGVWPPQYKVKHINWLELKAVQLALQTFSNKSTIQKCASENRQCNCRQLSEQTGRYPIPRPLLLGMGSFEMVHKSQCQNPSCSYSGKKNIIADALSRGE
ncbi:unnamed protein product [Mytilus coruscus]|uniref:Reverse transcriptase RNase H-like domain-containing protein n=1 Tax=Mytilus coruscus TaxID=42192 RepID=A0A6J8BXT6_MYTCO|nr:unnamed protein product [Mytilus coruscus]